MRTALFLVAGFLLAGSLLMLGKLFAGQYPQAARASTWLFVALWLLIAAVNMWLGVSKAGYSVSEELPIFLLIFAVPAIAAVVVYWKVL
jgi:hypothetical protein